MPRGIFSSMNRPITSPCSAVLTSSPTITLSPSALARASSAPEISLWSVTAIAPSPRARASASSTSTGVAQSYEWSVCMCRSTSISARSDSRARSAAGLRARSWRRAASSRVDVLELVRDPRPAELAAACRAGALLAAAAAPRPARAGGPRASRPRPARTSARARRRRAPPRRPAGATQRRPRPSRARAPACRGSARCPRRRTRATSAVARTSSLGAVTAVDERHPVAQPGGRASPAARSAVGTRRSRASRARAAAARSARRKVRSAARSSVAIMTSSRSAAPGLARRLRRPPPARSRGTRRGSSAGAGCGSPRSWRSARRAARTAAGTAAASAASRGSARSGRGSCRRSARASGAARRSRRSGANGSWTWTMSSAQRAQRLLDRPRDVDRQRRGAPARRRERQHLADAEHDRLAVGRFEQRLAAGRGAPGGCRARARRSATGR